LGVRLVGSGHKEGVGVDDGDLEVGDYLFFCDFGGFLNWLCHNWGFDLFGLDGVDWLLA